MNQSKAAGKSYPHLINGAASIARRSWQAVTARHLLVTAGKIGKAVVGGLALVIALRAFVFG